MSFFYLLYLLYDFRVNTPVKRKLTDFYEIFIYIFILETSQLFAAYRFFQFTHLIYNFVTLFIFHLLEKLAWYITQKS